MEKQRQSQPRPPSRVLHEIKQELYKEETKRVSLIMPRALHTQFKTKVTRNDKTMTELILRWIENYLK